ncbi:IclR family transcriptional regulator [Prescottella agglutinans]|uniref:IclR family transcriptional regulator n=1 Tax=Prescottella agglutinans TaxID=1644129 RepID=A0A3S3BS20_9NOCA|nr:IclR family transcriptional regulator [Prescottella agglutinans]RVW07883.1 IclR family transcriptional regulator [Prescottella agglutinans]
MATRGPHGGPPVSLLERVTLILDTFDSPTSRLTLEEITRRTQLPRSTLHRILDKLVRLEWLEHLSTGYRLGRRALELGSNVDHSDIRSAAAPLLHALHMRTGLVVHLAILDQGYAVYLDKVGGRSAALAPTRVGGRVPAYSTAAGKSMLAWHDPERIHNLYEARLDRRTDRTIADLATLHQELRRIRQRRGVAFERGEFVSGVACVGVAVRSHDLPVAAISLCGDERSTKLDRFAPILIDAALEASRTLDVAPDSPRVVPVVRLRNI